ncbi:MAG: GTP-binding protein [Micromonosporaceae bacterium]|nr:GTP-binding protein [Micromonosporaceae bacterium]
MAPVWLDVVDETVRVCAAHGRTDLVRRLQQKRAQLLDSKLRVLVTGEPKQGKSQLVNALINAAVCPAGDGPTTSVPTVVHHAEVPTATLVHTAAGEPAGPAAVPDRTPVPVGELASRINASQAGRPDGAVLHAEVGVPRGLLASGLVLVDGPGFDGDGSGFNGDAPGFNGGAPNFDGDAPSFGGGEPASRVSPVASPARADVVVLVSDATRELSVAEVDLLLRMAREHPHIVVALTKIDLVPHWRLVADRNRQHLASAGVSAPLVPVSATLRLQAAQANDQAINAESGFPELIARLIRSHRAKRDVLAPATVGLLVSTVIQQLATPLRAGLSAAGASEPLARLHEAQRALDQLRRCSTSWQNTLGDEMANLLSDVEYDLRDRTRQILREVDEAFDAADPLRAWGPFQSWLETACTDAAEANFAWLVQRCDWIVNRVAGHLAGYGEDGVPEWSVETPGALSERLAAIEQPNVERFTPLQMAFAGLRGSYIGVLMFGLATTLAGMPLINPISLGAGALFAGKSIRDESKSLLKRRQATAKSAAQRHVDDFFLRLNKECKDTARWVQHLLRDHYTALTEQIHDGIVHSARTAKQAADADAVERDQRHRDIQAQMRRLAVLYERAQQLAAARAAPTVGGPAPAVDGPAPTVAGPAPVAADGPGHRA